MSLIYSMIGRGNDIVLVENAVQNSNFPHIVRTMLPKLKKNTRMTYLYNQNHYFHYINDQDMTYLCLTDKIFSKRAAFAYLEDIKELFCQNYSADSRMNSVPMGMQTSFEEQLKTKMSYFNSQPENEKIQRLQNNLNDVKDQMVENIDKILDREDQIQVLVQKSNTMDQYAGSYKNAATSVRRDQEWRSMKMKIFIGGTIVAVILVMIIIGF